MAIRKGNPGIPPPKTSFFWEVVHTLTIVTAIQQQEQQGQDKHHVVIPLTWNTIMEWVPLRDEILVDNYEERILSLLRLEPIAVESLMVPGIVENYFLKACECGHERLVREFLEFNNAPVDLEEGMELAVLTGHVGMLTLFIDKLPCVFDSLASLIDEVVDKGHVECFRAMLRFKVPPTEGTVISAAEGGNKECLMMVLDADPNLIDVKKYDDHSLAHLACAVGKAECLEVLLQRKPSLAFEQNMAGRTPLHIACNVGSMACVRVILNAAKTASPHIIHILDKKKTSAIQLAFNADHTDIVRFLLDSTPATISTEGYMYHVAARTGHVEWLRSRLFINRSMITALDVGETLLQVSVDYGQLECIQLLLNMDPSQITNVGLVVGWIPNEECVRFLLNIDPTLTKHQDTHGFTALHAAVKLNHEPTVRTLLQFDPSLTKVLNGQGQSALYIAAEEGRAECLHILLTADPSMADVADHEGRCPLYAAVKQRCDESRKCVHYLLTSNPNLTAKRQRPLREEEQEEVESTPSDSSDDESGHDSESD
eukprot:PhF_6_TR8326/c0_g1_i9/m.12982